MMNMPTEKPLWTITGYHDQTEYDAEKGTVPVVRVDFKMHNGTESHVIVPRSGFDSDSVAQMVHEHASKIHELMNYSGPLVSNNPFETVPPVESLDFSTS